MLSTILRIYACLFILICANLTQAATVKSIRIWHGPEYTRVVLDLDEPVQHNVVLASNPDRIILDATNATLKSSLANLALAETPVDVIRSSIINKKDLRLIFDLNKPVTIKSFTLKKQADNNDRLVIDLFDVPVALVTNKAASSKTSGVNKSTGVANAKSPANNLDEPADLEDLVSSVEKSSVSDKNTADVQKTVTEKPQIEKQQIEKPVTEKTIPEKPFTEIAGKRTILISVDAGHGGEDAGALGPNNMREKDVTLAIAKELVNEINSQPGFNARLTRTGDYYLALAKRRDLARDIKADLLISVHADSFTNSLARGASVFALSRKGATSEAARFLAQRENESDLIGGVGGVSLDDKDAVLAGVLVDLSMTATVNSSLQVGNYVLNAISSFAPLHTNHVEQAGFLVLKSPDVPSILVETGFISNKEESRKLASPSYREQMAQSIFKGVRQYFTQNPPAGTYLASPSAPAQSNAEHKYTVVRGDTLAEIAERYNVNINHLLKYNGLTSSAVKVGQIIKIPAS